MKWEKVSRTVSGNGEYAETTIRYAAEGTELKIESRKRAIPHTARSGSWMHTTYFLIRPDGSEKEYWTLGKAKEAAERSST